LVHEVVKLKVDVISANGPPVIVATLKATRTLPVIGIDLESDPVASGFVQSLAGRQLLRLLPRCPRAGRASCSSS